MNIQIPNMPLNSILVRAFASLIGIALGIVMLNIDFTPGGLRSDYREAMRYPLGVSAILLSTWALIRVILPLITGKALATNIELTDTHLNHYSLQLAIPYTSIVALEVPREGDDIDVRFIVIRWLDSSGREHDYYLDFRTLLRSDRSFERVLRALEHHTGLEAVERGLPQNVAKLPLYMRWTRL